VDNPFNIRASRTATCLGNVDNIEHDNAEICKLAISPHHHDSSLLLSSFQTATPVTEKREEADSKIFVLIAFFFLTLPKQQTLV
jgi:hypothetical protein